MKLGMYDGSLQMFVDEPRKISLPHLGFFRWLVEHERVEDAAIHGPASGRYAQQIPMTDHDPLPLAA